MYHVTLVIYVAFNSLFRLWDVWVSGTSNMALAPTCRFTLSIFCFVSMTIISFVSISATKVQSGKWHGRIPISAVCWRLVHTTTRCVRLASIYLTCFWKFLSILVPPESVNKEIGCECLHLFVLRFRFAIIISSVAFVLSSWFKPRLCACQSCGVVRVCLYIYWMLVLNSLKALILVSNN